MTWRATSAWPWMQAAFKEGGKKGVEIEGAADMSGLECFCTRMPAAQVGLDRYCSPRHPMRFNPSLLM
jgi:hypothetical protein